MSWGCVEEGKLYIVPLAHLKIDIHPAKSQLAWSMCGNEAERKECEENKIILD